jgi:hypothetical protein
MLCNYACKSNQCILKERECHVPPRFPRSDIFIHPPNPLSILIHLRLPPLPLLLRPRCLLLRRPSLHLNPLPCPQNLTLQIKAPAILRVVRIKQPLKPLHDLLHVRLPVTRRRCVEDLARLVQREPRRFVCSHCSRAFARGGGGVLLRCLGLFVGFGDGAPEDAAAGGEDLCYYAVRLGKDGLVLGGA